MTSATVKAVKYCNLGMLTRDKFKEIITLQPEVEKEIKLGIY